MLRAIKWEQRPTCEINDYLTNFYIMQYNTFIMIFERTVLPPSSARLNWADVVADVIRRRKHVYHTGRCRGLGQLEIYLYNQQNSSSQSLKQLPESHSVILRMKATQSSENSKPIKLILSL